MNKSAICHRCGEPMPEGEEMFFYHGYSGPCPKSTLVPTNPSQVEVEEIVKLKTELQQLKERHERLFQDWYKECLAVIELHKQLSILSSEERNKL